MNGMYAVGDMVKTKRGAKLKAEGVITEVMVPSKDIQMLWGSVEPHYIVKDRKTGEYLSVIERGIEQV